MDLSKYMTATEIEAWLALDGLSEEEMVVLAEKACGFFWTATREFIGATVPPQIRDAVLADTPEWDALSTKQKAAFRDHSFEGQRLMTRVLQNIEHFS